MGAGGDGDHEAGVWHQDWDTPLCISHPLGAQETLGLLIGAPINTQCPSKVLSMSIFIFPLINHIVLSTLFLSSLQHMNGGKRHRETMRCF